MSDGQIIDETNQLVLHTRWSGYENDPVLAECLRCFSIFSDRNALAARQCPKCEVTSEVTNQMGDDSQERLRSSGFHDDGMGVRAVREEVTMAATLPTVPALPDEATLARDIPGRPDWRMIAESLDGAHGKDLYAMGSDGAQAVEELTSLDTCLKIYLPEFQDWYWSSAFGRAKKAIDEIDQALRLAEEKRVKEARKRIGDVNGEFLQAREDAREANERRLAEQQRHEAEESKAATLAALEVEKAACPAEQQAEVQQQIEEVKAAPVVPVSVSKAQAEVGLPSAPAKVIGRKVYLRRIEYMQPFLKWLAEHPDYAATLGLSVTFAKLKNNSMVIPGVTVEEKYESSNRNR